MPWITRVVLCFSILVSFVGAAALPLQTSSLATSAFGLGTREIKRDSSHIVGVNPMQRTLLSSTVVICVFLLGLALGTRVKQIHVDRFRFIDSLVVIQTWLAVFFALCVGVIGPGLGLKNSHQCRSSIVICIIFYLVGKMVMYQFLIERAHVIRSAFLTRYHDRIWMTFTTLNALGLGSLTIIAAIVPKFHFDTETGTCNVGFNHYVAVVGITIDIAMNVALTVVFIWLLWPVIRIFVLRSSFHSSKPTSRNATLTDISAQEGASPFDSSAKTAEQDRHDSIAVFLNRLGARTSTFTRRHKAARSQRSFFTSIRTMLARNIIGSTAMLAASVTNGILFFVWHERPSAWLCLSLCVMDMSFGTLVVHWLAAVGPTTESNAAQSPCATTKLLPNGQIPYSDNSVDAPLPELKTYEQVTMTRSKSPARPEQSHLSGNSL